MIRGEKGCFQPPVGEGAEGFYTGVRGSQMHLGIFGARESTEMDHFSVFISDRLKRRYKNSLFWREFGRSRDVRS